MKNIEISWKHGLNIETRWLYNLSYLFYTRFSGYILKIYEHAELSKKLWENLETLESNVKISDNKYKKFIFNDNTIYYILENSLLTVYTDKERQRENFSIILTTKMDRERMSGKSSLCILFKPTR